MIFLLHQLHNAHFGWEPNHFELCQCLDPRKEPGWGDCKLYSPCGILLKLALLGVLEMADHPHGQPWMEQTQTGNKRAGKEKGKVQHLQVAGLQHKNTNRATSYIPFERIITAGGM
jgi:hypothetical protein